MLELLFLQGNYELVSSYFNWTFLFFRKISKKNSERKTGVAYQENCCHNSLSLINKMDGTPIIKLAIGIIGKKYKSSKKSPQKIAPKNCSKKFGIAPKSWSKELGQRVGPKSWSKELLQRVALKCCSKELLQRVAPESCSKQLFQKIASKNWNCSK